MNDNNSYINYLSLKNHLGDTKLYWNIFSNTIHYSSDTKLH